MLVKCDKVSIRFIKKGGELEELNKLKGATGFYGLALLYDPSSMEARVKLGKVLRKRKLYNQAIWEHERAKIINPNFSSNLNHLAISLVENHNYKAAAEEAQLALKINPRLGQAHYTLAIIHDLKKQYSSVQVCEKI